MHYKLLIFTLLLSTSNIYADKFDNVKELENKAFEESKNINISQVKTNINQSNFEQNISNIYQNTQSNIEKERKRIVGESKEEMNNLSKLEKGKNNQNNTINFIQKNRIYVFMSESVPIEIWNTYGTYMSDNKLINSSLVLRGCVGGNCEKIKPTADFILSINKHDKNHEINPNVIIDPMLFRKYNITRVPCVVYAEDVKTIDLRMSEGNDENFSAKNIYKSCGDWSLEYHLRELQKQSNSISLQEMIDNIGKSNEN